ncbi:NAD(P)/FAD-dependent oxidoreductase [Leptospira sp. 96542]|nr:NAD(P)/FAD-dependent oxidoreductase [Leptospira sp. 96542]
MVKVSPNIAIIGAGAGGCFSAIQIHERMSGDCKIQIFEKTKEPLSKLKVSGGGRCNVTHNLFDPESLASKYPRGEKELKFAFKTFGPKETMSWFSKRGIKLKVEEDGRIFPESDLSTTIIDCFLSELKKYKIPIQYERQLVAIYPPNTQFNSSRSFRCLWEGGKEDFFDKVVLATGSNRKIWQILEKMGLTIIPPVPSLFTLGIEGSDIVQIPGVVAPKVKIKIGHKGKYQSGTILITHWGFSGPAALRLSAFEAKTLFELNYHTNLYINWTYDLNPLECENHYLTEKQNFPPQKIQPKKEWGLPTRLWEFLLMEAKISENKRYSEVSKYEIKSLSSVLTNSEFVMTKKGVFKEEFVTAGGVARKEINFEKMESKKIPGLYFSGEVIDVDGITGGFNFQNAWTTAYLVSKGIYESSI